MARITQALKEETRALIIQESKTLFSVQGYQQTKTKTIAKNCGIAEGTLFNYFSSKDEILIAVFEELANQDDEVQIDNLPTIEDLLWQGIMKPFRNMNAIPRGFLIDLLVASIKLMHKKPKLVQKLIALDFAYLQELEERLMRFCAFEDCELTPRELSEMIYGVVVSDFLLYLFEPNRTYLDFETASKRKVNALIKGYLKGGNYVDLFEKSL